MRLLLNDADDYADGRELTFRLLTAHPALTLSKEAAVPDGDVFTRSARVGWRGVAAALRDGLPVEECARRLDRALANQLRRTHGLQASDLQAALGTLGDSRNEDDVRRALELVARRDVFDRVVPLLVTAGRFPTFDVARRFVAACLDQSQFRFLARSLVRRPDAVGLRRPSGRASSTADLLNEAAPLGSRA